MRGAARPPYSSTSNALVVVPCARLPPVVVDTALHRRVRLDAPDEVAGRAEQGDIEVLHRRQESLGHRWLHKGLKKQKVASRVKGKRFAP